MHNLGSFLSSTLGRKVLMALSGIVLVLCPRSYVRQPADFSGGDDQCLCLQAHHELPTELLWAVRLVLLATIGVHIWAAVSLTLDNRRARPDRYDTKKTVQASYVSYDAHEWSHPSLPLSFPYSSLHRAFRSWGMRYEDPNVLQPTEVPLVKQGEVVMKDGQPVMTFNVNDMMVTGFKFGGSPSSTLLPPVFFACTSPWSQ